MRRHDEVSASNMLAEHHHRHDRPLKIVQTSSMRRCSPGSHRVGIDVGVYYE